VFFEGGKPRKLGFWGGEFRQVSNLFFFNEGKKGPKHQNQTNFFAGDKKNRIGGGGPKKKVWGF